MRFINEAVWGTRISAVILCQGSCTQEILTTCLPEQNLNNDSTNRHSTVDEGNLIRPHPEMKSY